MMFLVNMVENFANLLNFPFNCLSRSSLAIFFGWFGERDLSLTDCFYFDFDDTEFLSAFSLSFFRPLMKFGVLFYFMVKIVGSTLILDGFGGVVLIFGGLYPIYWEYLRLLRNLGERHPLFLVIKGINIKSTIFDVKLFLFFLSYAHGQFPKRCTFISSIFS